jgi:hypothetical protein
MKEQKDKDILKAFFAIADNDVRLSATHLGVYFVLYKLWVVQGCKDFVRITRKRVMQQAKIRSTATYTRLMHDLDQFGYIRYMPSYHPLYGTTVSLCTQ